MQRFFRFFAWWACGKRINFHLTLALMAVRIGFKNWNFMTTSAYPISLPFIHYILISIHQHLNDHSRCIWAFINGSKKSINHLVQQ
jgi:hypothetical protein